MAQCGISPFALLAPPLGVRMQAYLHQPNPELQKPKSLNPVSEFPKPRFRV